MKNFIRERHGFIHHTKSHFVHNSHGSGIKAIVHHRHMNHHDPNVEVLKESLHRISLRGPQRKKKAVGGSMTKKSKYIIF